MMNKKTLMKYRMQNCDNPANTSHVFGEIKQVIKNAALFFKQK
jgi:hypothetical protein